MKNTKAISALTHDSYSIHDQLTLGDHNGFIRFEELRGYMDLENTRPAKRVLSPSDFLGSTISCEHTPLRSYSIRKQIEKNAAMAKAAAEQKNQQEWFTHGLLGI